MLDLPRLFGKQPIERSDAERLAATLKAVADPSRLRLLSLIATARRPLQTHEVVDAAGLSQPTVSHHLMLLHEAGLLDRHPEGRGVWYAIDLDGFSELAHAIRPGRAW